MSDAALMTLVRTIVTADDTVAFHLLAANPALAKARFEIGVTRQTAETYYMDEIGHYVYAGDTALHVAAAAYRQKIVPKLIAMGANVRARNRRGAEPLHYAVDGTPGSRAWNPDAQAATVACLIEAGADPVASRCTHALRLSRKGPSRRRCRPSTQEQKRLDTDAACDSEYRSWWLGLTRSESTTGADRRTASGAHYQPEVIRPV